MNLFRLGSSALMLGFGMAFSGCLNAPDYAIEPAIDFNRIDVVHVPRSSVAAVDTLHFLVDFRDGDGDLGLSEDDINVAPFNTGNGRFNYFIKPFKKDASGNFVPFINGSEGEYDSTFPRLDKANAKPAPLKGTLRFTQYYDLAGAPFRPGQVFRFEISIRDRALHASNKITTSEITLGQ